MFGSLVTADVKARTIVIKKKDMARENTKNKQRERHEFCILLMNTKVCVC